MDYALDIENAPDVIPGGTAILLLHPSTAETDRIDTDFLKAEDDFLVVSTRTTAREVMQKLEHYGVADFDDSSGDNGRADILDTISVERGYSRRGSEHIHYVNAPDDVTGIVQQVRKFLDTHDGGRRVSFDSITELAYYADVNRAIEGLEQLVQLLEDHDAVGIFHVSKEVHDDATIDRFRALCDGVVDLDEDGTVTADF